MDEEDKASVLADAVDRATQAAKVLPRACPTHQRTAEGASGKGPDQKKSKIVKKCQIFSTLFDHLKFSGSAKNVKNRQKVSKICFDIFLTSFARHQFSGPFLD